ncbi:MAG: transposase [Acidobacteriia bacterium]|nr:transposase [Terriglobia bacterium]
MTSSSVIRRAYRFPLKPTKKQARILEAALAICQEIYNAALQERRDAWKCERKSICYNDQTAELTEIREFRPDVAMLPVDLAREPLRRVDRAFRAFFRRCKAGQRPGFPRFRSRDRYDSMAISAPRFKVDADRVAISKLGSFRFRAHREIKGTPKQCIIKRVGSNWQVSIVCELGPVPEKLPMRNDVGIDVGLKTFATLSDGTEIPNPRWARQSENEIADSNRALARKKRGSKNRRKAKEALRRAHQRVANRRLNFCHHVSKALVSTYDQIYFEALKIQSMLRGNLSKSIMDAAWATLLFQLSYKAAWAGKWAIPVDPRGTTQRCSGCGETAHKSLSERAHSCPHCGLILGRDHNSSINILQAGRAYVSLRLQESSKRN